MPKAIDDEYSAKESARREEEVLRRLLKSPPTPFTRKATKPNQADWATQKPRKPA